MLCFRLLNEFDLIYKLVIVFKKKVSLKDYSLDGFSSSPTVKRFHFVYVTIKNKRDLKRQSLFQMINRAMDSNNLILN